MEEENREWTEKNREREEEENRKKRKGAGIFTQSEGEEWVIEREGGELLGEVVFSITRVTMSQRGPWGAQPAGTPRTQHGGGLYHSCCCIS